MRSAYPPSSAEEPSGRRAAARSTGAPARRTLWRRAAPWILFATFVVATLARGTDSFYWDADHYWQATLAVVGVNPEVPPGYWDLRGFWTALVFTPAAAATRVLGDQHAALLVLLQNAVVFGAVAVTLVPAVMSRWQKVTVPMLTVGAAMFWAATSGFAPFPLVDVYAAVAILAVVVLLDDRRRPWAIIVAGVAAGVAVNLRPAYLLPVALVTVAVLVWRRWRGALFPAGVLIALAPQALLSLVQSGRLSLLPGGSGELVALQTGYASYVVRYDTIFGAANARQFFCSPEMARLVGDNPPASLTELVGTFLGGMPTSVQFALEKVAASLRWETSIPYSGLVTPIDTVFGLVVTVVTVGGLASLLFISTRRRGTPPRRDWFMTAVVIAILVGTAATLVASATESRFALMLVILGGVGIALLASADTWRERSRMPWWAIAATLLTVLTLVLAHTGLDNPAPRGEVTASMCATL